MSDNDDEEYDFSNADFGDSGYGNFNEEEILARVIQLSIKTDESEKAKAAANEAKRRTINQKELKFCIENELVFVVIPSGNNFDRYFISRKLFPSSYFFDTYHDESLFVVPDESEVYDMDTAYMLFPTPLKRYHNNMPIKDISHIIYPTRAEEREKERMMRDMKRKERDIKRRERDAKREERKENLKQMRAAPGDEEYLRLVKEKYALFDFQDELLDNEDVRLKIQDDIQDNADDDILCTVCKTADAQVRCRQMKCVGVFCDACYNMTRFNDGKNAECRVCRRSL